MLLVRSWNLQGVYHSWKSTHWLFFTHRKDYGAGGWQFKNWISIPERQSVSKKSRKSSLKWLIVNRCHLLWNHLSNVMVQWCLKHKRKKTNNKRAVGCIRCRVDVQVLTPFACGTRGPLFIWYSEWNTLYYKPRTS